MRSSVGWLFTVALLVPGAGCLTWGRQQGETKNSTAAPTSGDATTTQKDLPPEETAAIMLSAAAQLEKKGSAQKALQAYEQALALDPSCGDRIAHHLALLYDKT